MTSKIKQRHCFVLLHSPHSRKNYDLVDGCDSQENEEVSQRGENRVSECFRSSFINRGGCLATETTTPMMPCYLCPLFGFHKELSHPSSRSCPDQIFGGEGARLQSGPAGSVLFILMTREVSVESCGNTVERLDRWRCKKSTWLFKSR